MSTITHYHRNMIIYYKFTNGTVWIVPKRFEFKYECSFFQVYSDITHGDAHFVSGSINLSKRFIKSRQIIVSA